MELPKIQYALERTREGEGTIVTHSHSSWEIVCYLSGSGKSQIGNTIYEYTAGDVCLIPPETGHSEINTDKTRLVFCVFDPVGFECNGGLYHGDDEICDLAERIARIEYSHNRTDVTVAALYLTVILVRLGNSLRIPGTTDSRGNRSLDSACHYIFDYFNTDIDLTELATSVGYSYDRFRHIFRQRYGLPPKQMILFKRIDAAKTLLLGNGKIANIARECGFSSASQFNTAFRKSQGITPSQYRKKCRSSGE